MLMASNVHSILAFVCLLSTSSASEILVQAACNVSWQEQPYWRRTAFSRVNITDAIELGAVCNDLSAGLYYISKTNSSKWLIFLESGSGCGSIEDCNERYIDQEELMTSKSYPDTIEGKDVFSPHPRVNPDYWDYNFVLVPYCTSDLWIGNSTWNNETKANASRGWRFQENATFNQFAFRGSPLFRAVIGELLSDGLSAAVEVVLAGSSAGGLGVLNQAGWLQGEIPKARMSAILDSSWFINFDNNLVENFNFDFLEKHTNYLLHEPCRDNDTVGYPCCVSASCMLSKPIQLRSSLDFPDIPVFAIFSMYDLYIVAESIRKLENRSQDFQLLEAFRTIAEYGGAMNFSLETSQHAAKNMSYFVPSCLQHVYLATSSLWDDGGVLNNSVNSSNFNSTLGNTKFFKHVVKEGTWARLSIKANTGQRQSLQCAIHEWNEHIRSTRHDKDTSPYPVRYIDYCFGARCNSECPETVLLSIFPDFWPVEVQFILISMVLLITMLCIFYKSVMAMRMRWLLQDYETFLTWDRMERKDEKRGLPYCSPSEAIGIAFLNLRYSIRLSPQALAQAKKLQEEKLAAEEESRALLGLTDDSDEEAEEAKSRKRQLKKLSWCEPREKKSFLKRLLCCYHRRPYKLSNSQSCDMIVGNNDIELGLVRPTSNGRGVHNGEVGDMFASPSRPTSLSPTRSQTLPEAAMRQQYRLKSPEFEVSDKQRYKSYTMPARVHSPKVEDEKMIIKGISSYFNPGQLVAIMGPSGCGKTTFLDLLTGRRRKGIQKGEIFINGMPAHSVHDWYIKHTGYVLQLAVPYYEELTVKQNLLMSAVMRLPHSMTQQERFERVEEVIHETGLSTLKDTVVGGSTGPGLSGGQKRRLSVAIQLLSMPKVIFLDEPTSGLDASSSMELLQHLRYVAMSGRMVVLTIHQPRLEIFHMFDRILFLCQGEVAYYGSPTEAPSLFLKAYHYAKLEGEAPVLDQTKNPADVIMDMLGSEKFRTAILNYYKLTTEVKAVETAIKNAKREESSNKHAVENEESDSGWENRFFALETRASMRGGLSQAIYLPIIFLIYALVLGLAYLQADTILLIMAAFCVFSFGSSIFMFPAVYTHLSKSLQIYRLEREDGIGRSFEVLLQTFMRYVAIAAAPLVGCSLILYIMVLKPEFWTFLGFFNVTVFSLAMNQTWTALSIMLVCVFPVHGHKISPLMNCAAGFAGGFLIPAPQMKPYFSWLFFINPNFYGYGSMMRLIMPDIEIGCEFDSTIECYPSTGKFWLEHFGFTFIQPYMSLLIMMGITLAAFLGAWFSLEKRCRGLTFLDIILHCRLRRSTDIRDELADHPSEESSQQSEESSQQSEEAEANSEDEFHVASTHQSSEDEDENENEDEDEDVEVEQEEEPKQESPVRRQRRMSNFTRYSDARGLKRRNRATEEELEEAAKKASEEATKNRRNRFQRQMTRTALLPTREHSVFCPDSEHTRGTRTPSFSRMSRRDRRIRTARETQEKQQLMETRMARFQQLQDQLNVDDPDVEALTENVPVRRLTTRLRASLYRKDQQRQRSPGTRSMSSLDPLKKRISRSVEEVKRPAHLSTTSLCPAVICMGNLADLRRGSASSGMSFDVNKLAPGSDSDVTTPQFAAQRVPVADSKAANVRRQRKGRRASVTFAMDVIDRDSMNRDSNSQQLQSPSPLIPKSVMKRRPKSLQSSPQGSPSPLATRRVRKTGRQAMTPDLDPDVANSVTRRYRRTFKEQPWRKSRRRTPERVADGIDGPEVYRNSSEEETSYDVGQIQRGLKKRSKVSQSQLANEVADILHLSPSRDDPVLMSHRSLGSLTTHLAVGGGSSRSSGSSDDGEVAIRAVRSHSSSPSIILTEDGRRMRPSTLDLGQERGHGRKVSSGSCYSDDAFAPAMSPTTPKISITQWVSADSSEPPDIDDVEA